MTCRKLAAWESLSCKVKSLVIRNVKHVVNVPVDILGLWLVRVTSQSSSRHEMRDPLLCKKRVMDVRHRGANAHGDGGFGHGDEKP